MAIFNARLAKLRFIRRPGDLIGGLDTLVFTAGIGDHDAESLPGSAGAAAGWV